MDASTRFARCLDIVLQSEGGFVDHPRDPGGATNLGITQATLAAHRGRPVSKDEVRALTRAEASEIYRRRYWDVIRAADLRAGVDLAVFDPAVNSGPGRAARWLQAAVSAPVDGAVGPVTVAAANRADAVEVVKAICARRMSFLRSLGTFDVFGRGWSRRVAKVEATGVRWAVESAGVAPRPILIAEAEAAAGAAARNQNAARGSAVAAPAGAIGAEQATEMPSLGIGAFVVVCLVVVVVALVRHRQNRERASAYQASALEAKP